MIRKIAFMTVVMLLTGALDILLLSPGAAAAGGVRIYGFVLDKDGQPVTNVTVTLLIDGVPLTTGSNPAITNINGYFEFPGIQKGSYCLLAEKFTYSSSATFLVQTQDKRVDLTMGGTSADLADVREPAPTPTPVPTATPTVTATATEMPTPTPPPAATPGFGLALAVLGILSCAAAFKWKK